MLTGKLANGCRRGGQCFVERLARIRKRPAETRSGHRRKGGLQLLERLSPRRGGAVRTQRRGQIVRRERAPYGPGGSGARRAAADGQPSIAVVRGLSWIAVERARCRQSRGR